MASHLIVVDADGTFGALYDDAIAELLAEVAAPGTLRIRRASDVEPVEAGLGWRVAIRAWVPGGGVVLGPGGVGDPTPFPTRAAALAAERRYLETRAL